VTEVLVEGARAVGVRTSTGDVLGLAGRDRECHPAVVVWTAAAGAFCTG
jgi:hypothetical protein